MESKLIHTLTEEQQKLYLEEQLELGKCVGSKVADELRELYIQRTETAMQSYTKLHGERFNILLYLSFGAGAFFTFICYENFK